MTSSRLVTVKSTRPVASICDEQPHDQPDTLSLSAAILPTLHLFRRALFQISSGDWDFVIGADLSSANERQETTSAPTLPARSQVAKSSLEFANYFRLVLNNQPFYGPSVARARVINAHTLTRSER